MSYGEGGPSVLCDLAEIVRLGEGTSRSKLLGRGAMERTLRVVCEMARSARLFGADEIVAVGTQALREAQNAGEFIERARSGCRVEIRVISGEEEAALSFEAALFEMGRLSDRTAVCVFDVGGGSSEIVCGGKNGVRSRVSLPVGALSLHAAYFKGLSQIRGEVVREACGRVRALLCEVPESRAADDSPRIVGVGGTITTLACVMMGRDLTDHGTISGAELSLSEAEHQIAMYAATPLAERRLIKGLNPKRADIILAGACIVRELLLRMGGESLTVSARGLRYGVMKKVFG